MITAVQKDNGGKCTGGTFLWELEGCEIEAHTTILYTSQEYVVSQNGNRVVGHANSLRQQTSASKFYLGEAVQTVVYLKNSSLTKGHMGRKEHRSSYGLERN